MKRFITVFMQTWPDAGEARCLDGVQWERKAEDDGCSEAGQSGTPGKS